MKPTPLSSCPIVADNGATPFPHPGTILHDEFLAPLGLSRNELARRLAVPVMRISEICAGKRGITADTAVRLGAFFAMPAEFWLNLQARYDLRQVSTGKIVASVRPWAAGGQGQPSPRKGRGQAAAKASGVPQ